MPARGLRPIGLALSIALAVSCTGEGEGRPDSELGNLVVSPTLEIPKVDLGLASTKAGALVSAVLLPHHWIGESLGAHVVKGSSSVKVEEGSEIVEQLDDALSLEFDGEGRFAATLDNSKDYGRHAIFDGEHLYLRPRFGLYHGRKPQTETEASEIRNEIFGGAGDYLELISRQLEVSDRGAKTRDGRAVREVALKRAPNPRDVTPETLGQRKWRDTIEVKTASGLVALDAETGAALYVLLEGSVAYERDGRRFLMTVTAERTIKDVGHTRAVQAPAEDEVMFIKPRRRELDEREALLKSIAPPARKAPTPANPGGIQ